MSTSKARPIIRDRRRTMAAARRAGAPTGEARKVYPTAPAAARSAFAPWRPLVVWADADGTEHLMRSRPSSDSEVLFASEIHRALFPRDEELELVIRGRDGDGTPRTDPADLIPAEFVEWVRRDGVVEHVEVNGHDAAATAVLEPRRAVFAAPPRTRCEYRLPPFGARDREADTARLRALDPALYDRVVAMEESVARRLKR